MQGMRIAIIGGAAGDFIEYLQEQDINYTIFIDSRRHASHPNSIVSDMTSADAVCQTITAQKEAYTAVMTFYEEYMVLTAEVNAKLNLRGMSVDAAHACTDKTLMRAAFLQSHKHISPQFKVLKSLDDGLEFASQFGYPLILKPANLAKSLLVTKIHDENELRGHYFRIGEVIDEVYKRYAPRNKPKLLIEEFVEGSIHSLGAFVDGGGIPHLLEHIVDYQTGYDIGFDDNFHYSRVMPTSLTESQQEYLKSCAVAGIEALGMRYCPAHIEIIMSKNGPRIVEIGARNGGYRQKMHTSAHGINLYKNHLALLHDQPIDVTPKRSESCAVLELFARMPGTYKGLHNEDALKALASLKYLNIRSLPDEPVGMSRDGFKAVAVIMLHSADPEQFKKDLDFVNSNVYVTTN